MTYRPDRPATPHTWARPSDIPPAMPTYDHAEFVPARSPAKKTVMHSDKRGIRVVQERAREGEKMVDYEERAVVPSSSDSDGDGRPMRPGTPIPNGLRPPPGTRSYLPAQPNATRLVETKIYKAIDDFLFACHSESSDSGATPDLESVPLTRTRASRGRRRETLRRPSPIYEDSPATESSSRRKFKMKSKSRPARALPEGAAIATAAKPLHRSLSSASLKSILKVKTSPQVTTSEHAIFTDFTDLNSGGRDKHTPHPAVKQGNPAGQHTNPQVQDTEPEVQHMNKTYIISYAGGSPTSVEVTGAAAGTESEYSCVEDEGLDLNAFSASDDNGHDDEGHYYTPSASSSMPMSKTYVHSFHGGHTTTFEVDGGEVVSATEAEQGDLSNLDESFTDDNNLVDSTHESSEEENDLAYHLEPLTPVKVPAPSSASASVPTPPAMDAPSPTLSSSTASTAPPATPQTPTMPFGSFRHLKSRRGNGMSRELRAGLTESQAQLLGRVCGALAKTGLTDAQIVGILFDGYSHVLKAENEAGLAAGSGGTNAAAGPSNSRSSSHSGSGSGSRDSLRYYHSLGNDEFEAYIASILAKAQKSSRPRSAFNPFRKSAPVDEGFVELLRALKAGLGVILAEGEAAEANTDFNTNPAETNTTPFPDGYEQTQRDDEPNSNAEPGSWSLRRIPSLRRLPSFRDLVNATGSLKLRGKGKAKAKGITTELVDPIPALTSTTFLPRPPTPANSARFADESYTDYRDVDYDCDVESDGDGKVWGSRRLSRLVKKRTSARGSAYNSPASTIVPRAHPEYAYYAPGVGTVAETYARISGTRPQPKLAGSRRLHRLVNGDTSVDKTDMAKGKRLERFTLDDEDFAEYGNGLGVRHIRRPSIPSGSVRSTPSHRSRTRTLSIRSFTSVRSREAQETQPERPGTPVVSEWSDSTN